MPANSRDRAGCPPHLSAAQNHVPPAAGPLGRGAHRLGRTCPSASHNCPGLGLGSPEWSGPAQTPASSLHDAMGSAQIRFLTPVPWESSNLIETPPPWVTVPGELSLGGTALPRTHHGSQHSAQMSPGQVAQGLAPSCVRSCGRDWCALRFTALTERRGGGSPNSTWDARSLR